jgi:peroxiredoxin
MGILVLLAILLSACQSDNPSLLDQPAPDFTLPGIDGEEITLSDYEGRQPVLLFFHMAMGWPPCLQQIVDLQNDPAFQNTGAQLVSIAFDPLSDQAAVAEELGISVPMLMDTDHEVSEAYGVLQWAVASGEPGHTFALVDDSGKVVWLQDYGAPQNGGVMYVPVDELVGHIKENLAR